MTIHAEYRLRLLKLAVALRSGQVLQDVRICPVRHYVCSKTANYLALGKCPCGRPILIILNVHQQVNPAIFHAAICGGHCPDCDEAWTTEAVFYAGMCGWPGMPATTDNLEDLYLALKREHPRVAGFGHQQKVKAQKGEGSPISSFSDGRIRHAKG